MSVVSDEAVARPAGTPRTISVPWWVNGAFALGVLSTLFATSYPSLPLFSLPPILLGFGVSGLGWAVVGARALFAAGRRPSRTFAIAPVAFVVLVALVAVDAPFHARWAATRSRFEAIARDVDPDLPRSEHRALDVGPYVGTDEVHQAYQQGEAVVFYVEWSGGMDDAGVAYLPKGPFPELEDGGFERPQFTSIGGGWYTWTASW